MTVTAPEVARRLRVDPKAFRRWLRAQAHNGHPLLSGHVHNQRWEFTSGEADQLASDYVGKSSSGSNRRPGIKSAPRPVEGSSLSTAAEASVDWDTRYSSAFQEHGFQGFVRLGPAVSDVTAFLGEYEIDLSSAGVYAVFVTDNWTPRWRAQTPLPNVINPWSLGRLRDRWLDDVDLIYIGCAGATSSSRNLRKRLQDLLRHGSGKTSSSGPHKGGERLWQCVGWEEFALAWKPTGPYPEPHNWEVAIGERFQTLTGALPFANVRL